VIGWNEDTTYGTLPVKSKYVLCKVCIIRHTSIDDLIVNHVLPSCGRTGLVDPFWLIPVVMRDDAELNFGVRKLRYATA
jgi:hypothetical protein